MIILKRILLVIALMLTVSVGATACTTANAHQLEGILQNVDSANSTVTILTKDGKSVTLDVSTNATVNDGASSSVYSLEPGNSIKVSTDNHKRALEITVQSGETTKPPTSTPPATTVETFLGTITSIVGNNITITYEGKVQTTLLVDNSTVIVERTGVVLSLPDLKVGDQVEASYNHATMRALEITVQRGETGKTPPTTVETFLGTITSIVGNNITIINEGKIQVTLLIDNRTIIHVEPAGAVLSLSYFKVGDQVEASYNQATMRALEITVQS